MQLLAQDLNHALQADANNISDAELEDYYKKNESSYEQATVARIVVPRAKQIVPAQEKHEDAGSAGKSGHTGAANSQGKEQEAAGPGRRRPRLSGHGKAEHDAALRTPSASDCRRIPIN